jgi:hypothetical protein
LFGHRSGTPNARAIAGGSLICSKSCQWAVKMLL